MTRREVPEPILEILDRPIAGPVPDAGEIEALAERYPEFRDDLRSFASLASAVRAANAAASDAGAHDDETGERIVEVSGAEASERMRAIARRAMAAASVRTADASGDGAAVGRRLPPRSRSDATGHREARGPRLGMWIAGLGTLAAAVLVGWFLTRGGPDGETREGSFVARLERDPTQRGDGGAPDSRLRVEVARAGWLFAIAVDGDGAVRALYPLIDERGVVDYGVRGPFAPGDEVVFPPPDRDGFASETLAPGATLLIGRSTAEPVEDDLRRWISLAREAAARAPEDAAADEVARVLAAEIEEIVRTTLSQGEAKQE